MNEPQYAQSSPERAARGPQPPEPEERFVITDRGRGLLAVLLATGRDGGCEAAQED